MKRIIIISYLIFFAVCLTHAQIQSYITQKLKMQEVNINNFKIGSLENKNSEKKSVLLAVVSSLLIPGLGELYVGSFETGKYHMIAEGGLWVTYAGFRIHSNRLRKDAQTFAKQHAGANFDNKDDKYAVNIGNFNTTEEYNQTKLCNREYDLIYSGSQYNWSWDSDENRLFFKNTRIRSDAIKNNSKFIIAAVVINHLISAFTAGKKAAAYNRSITFDEVQIRAYTFTEHGGFVFNITSSF